MAKANTVWKAHDHSPIEKLSERLWRVEGSLPGIPMRRVMTIAKRADGDLVVHNGIAVRDEELAQITAWGRVGYIVVPNGYHRLDARVWKDRFPDAKVIGPAGGRKKIEQVVPLDATYADVSADANVAIDYLDGLEEQEGVMLVRDASGTSLVFNDAIFNMPHGHGVSGFVLKNITGSTGGPRVSNLMRWFVVKDKKALRTHLERLAEVPQLVRIVVSHHNVIDTDVAKTLKAVAASL